MQMILKSNKQKFQKKKKNQIRNWTNKSQKPAESSYIHKWTMPHTVLFWRNRGSLCCFFLCSGRILTTAHIPWERYTMLLLLLPSCSSLYIPRLFYSNRPVIVHTGVTFFLKRHHCFFHRIFKQRIVLQNVVMNGKGRFFWKTNDCYFKKGASPL